MQWIELKIKREKEICSFKHEFYECVCGLYADFQTPTIWICRTFEFYGIKTREWENPREYREQ